MGELEAQGLGHTRSLADVSLLAMPLGDVERSTTPPRSPALSAASSRRPDPLEYPWLAPTQAGLVDGDHFWDLDLKKGRRVGQAIVRHRDGRVDSVNKYLVEANAATIDSRVLVVAVGSNASPDVMRRKFARWHEPIRSVFPVFKCTVRGLDVGHSLHVSNGGYIAATPFASAGNELRLWGALLDRTQLAALDATEPNYDRVWVSAADYPLTMTSGELPAGYYLYRSVHGIVGFRGTPTALMSQPELFGRLAVAGAPIAADPVLAVEEFLQSEKPRAELTRWLAANVPHDDGVTGKVVDVLHTYGTVRDLSREDNAGALLVDATPDALYRGGEQCVVMHPDDAASRGLGRHVVLNHGARSDRPGVLARLHVDETTARGTVRCDQIVRNALGVERQETATVAPALSRARLLVDLLLGRSSWVMCRVQAADLASVEQDVALLDGTALQLLGVCRGEPVVIEGVPMEITRSASSVKPAPAPSIRLRAVELDEAVAVRRASLSGGSFDSRFPAAGDALGVFPDLPQVFLDAAQRRALGLGAHKLGAVRVRASRSAQLGTQIREVLLVLVLAFIGLASIFKDVAIVALLLVGVVAVAASVVIGRLRTQLGLRQSWRQRRR